jgi:hypothetical protein
MQMLISLLNLQGGQELMAEKTICQVTHKVCYTKKDALTTKNKMLKGRSRIKAKPQRAYHCEHCNFWHLTSHRMF